MFSLIISSPDKQNRREYIGNHCKDLNINKFDITYIERETALKQNVSSIGIEEIKNMHKKLFLKPLKSPIKAVVLEDAQLLTPEAQNALLKVLEEPPPNTLIILSVDSKEPLLPTIISRCKIIELKTDDAKLTSKQQTELTEFIENLPAMTIGEKFKKAELLSKDKEKAIDWTKNLILILHKKLTNDASPYNLSILKALLKLHALLKTTNANPRFAIEKTLLQIS